MAPDQPGKDESESDIVTDTAAPTSFTCPDCGMTSHHPDDAKHGYCGNCHAFTGSKPTELSEKAVTERADAAAGTDQPIVVRRHVAEDTGRPTRLWYWEARFGGRTVAAAIVGPKPKGGGRRAGEVDAWQAAAHALARAAYIAGLVDASAADGGECTTKRKRD
jgi:hypothetical protein